MKNETHTPGPWRVDPDDDFRVVDAQDCTISRTDFINLVEEHDWQIANARLIAAAPELLTACRLAGEKLSSVTQPGESGWDAVSACRDAINKAEGSSP